MSWNYRVATKIFSYKELKGFEKTDDSRLFSVIEVYYDEDGKINGYVDKRNPVSDLEDMGDLYGAYKLVGGAFEKPVLDLDNWPEEWDDTDFSKFEGSSLFLKGEEKYDGFPNVYEDFDEFIEDLINENLNDGGVTFWFENELYSFNDQEFNDQVKEYRYSEVIECIRDIQLNINNRIYTKV